MFQFRRFPTYAYLIQRTLLWYCHSGFPHSEISGSMLICSSPKLIAACHVLHRLLMPRHSPCALSSLTSSEQTPYPSPRSKAQGSLIPLLLLSKSKQVSISFLKPRNGASDMLSAPVEFRSCRSSSQSLELCRLIKKIFRNCNCITLNKNVSLLLPSHNLHHVVSMFSFQGTSELIRSRKLSVIPSTSFNE